MVAFTQLSITVEDVRRWVRTWFRMCCCLFVTVQPPTAASHLHLLIQTTRDTCLFSLFNHSMVNTWAANKYTHPGLPDMPSQQQQQEQPKDKVTVEKMQEVAITKVAAIENQLLMKQVNAKANAHQPGGPSMTKKPCVQAASSPNQSVQCTNKGQCMYLQIGVYSTDSFDYPRWLWWTGRWKRWQSNDHQIRQELEQKIGYVLDCYGTGANQTDIVIQPDIMWIECQHSHQLRLPSRRRNQVCTELLQYSHRSDWHYNSTMW